MEEDSIQQYLDSINNSIETIRRNTETMKDIEIPSDFRISMMGAKDSKVLNFIYDTKLDYVIDNMLDKIISGDYSDIEKYSDTIKKIFNTMGIGDGAFEGPISQLIMTNMMRSMNSINFNSTKSKIKKAMMLIKNLKKQSKYIEDKDQKKKYKEAVRSLKQTLKFIAKVYKNRRIISNRVVRGLNYAVNEELDCNEPLEGF